MSVFWHHPRNIPMKKSKWVGNTQHAAFSYFDGVSYEASIASKDQNSTVWKKHNTNQVVPINDDWLDACPKDFLKANSNAYCEYVDC